MKIIPKTFVALAVCLVLASGLQADDTHKAIDDLGRAAPNAGAKLLPHLDSDNPQHRWRAARALGLLKHQPAAAKLVALMDDSDPIVQLHAIVALGRIGDDSPATVDAIMKKVASDDARVARAAITSLRKLSPGPEKVAAAMEQVLESEDQAVMTFAVEALVESGGASVPLLEKMLRQEKTAYWAGLAISEIGADAADTAPALAPAIAGCEDPATLQQLLLAVAALGSDGKPAAQAVLDIANDTGDSAARIAACYALGSIGAESSTDLLRRLKGEGGEFQQLVCAWSICKLHPNDPTAQEEAIALLTAALKSDRPEVRGAAATGLSKLDAPSEKVAHALLSALDSADDEQKSNIAAALASLGPAVLDKAIPALDKDEFRNIAIEVIGRLGPKAADAAAPLAALLHDAPHEQQARINFALASIGPAAGSQGTAVVAGLKSSDEAVRQSALFALRKLGPQKRDVLHEIAIHYHATDSQFEKLAAAWAVAAMQPKGEVLAAVLDALPPGLKSSDAQSRFETIKAIGDLGPSGKPLAAKLRELAASDPDSDVRAAASEVADGL